MSAKIYENVFTSKEIDQLIDFYAGLPVSNTKYLPDGRLFRVMKNSEYNMEDQLSFKIINPKLTEVLGQHHFTGGHWMDSYSPFLLHIDNIASYNDRNVPVYESPLHKNIGVLIPLCENPHFHTVFFDHCLDVMNPQAIADLARSRDETLSDEFMQLMDHHPAETLQKIRHLKLDRVIEWKLGSIFSWPRDQLHCSSNFEKYNLNKQAIVLWL